MLDRGYLDRLLRSDVDDDVKRWVLALVHSAMSPSERREEACRWWRAAAALVPSEEPWTRARRLHLMALDLRGAIPADPDTTARGCVARALMLCAGMRPPSVDTLYRIACKPT